MNKVGGYTTEVQQRKENERLALENAVEEEKNIEIYGASSEDI